MAWLESHGNLARHPKTRRLMQRLGWTLPSTIGNLHLLWYWALDFAPTGDLSRFEPEQLTCDLDLGDATPEEFIQALIDCGFLDEIGSGSVESCPAGRSRRLHDWPDYTAKSLRSKFRRNPERWHQILRSYGLPVVTCRVSSRSRGTGALRAVDRESPSAMAESESEPAIALKSDPVDPNIASADSESSVGELPGPGFAAQDTAPSHARLVSRSDSGGFEPATHRNKGTNTATAEIPSVLASQPYFTDAWWPKLLELYKNKGCALTAYEQGEILAMLAKQPRSAVSMLRNSVENFETSFAALPALGGKRPINSS
jgi:hypothetical protein